jgi:hypothetical protein
LPKARTDTTRRQLAQCLLGASLLTTGVCLAQAASPGSSQVPVMDGAAGRCSLLLTVVANGKPVSAANVKVHIEYGFGGFHRLDLEAYTNTDGQVKFAGLPAKVHRPPLQFSGSKDQLSGIATYDPASECEAKHDLRLEKQVPAQ